MFIIYKKLLLVLILFSILFISCKNSPNSPLNKEEYTKQEATKSQKDTIYVINKTDTVFIDKQVKKVSKSEILDTSSINKQKIKIIQTEKKTPIVIDKSQNEETIYYKGTTKISTKITPWKDGTRYIRLYDRNGNQTYEFEDENKSYSSITNLRYNNDGSVIDATTNLNPGASMYWYVTTTKFKDDNQPTYQESIEYPEKLSAIMEGNRLKVWDPENKKWIPKYHD